MKHFSLSFNRGILTVLDQTKLPQKAEYKKIKTIHQAFRAIKELKVRGAPLIGVFAAYSLYISIKDKKAHSKENFINQALDNITYLKSARPTAVNLFWALNKIERLLLEKKNLPISKIKLAIKDVAVHIHREDMKLCDRIGSVGSRLIKAGDSILTHCNTGFLATSGIGTALAVIYKAHKKFPGIKVYADETRPLLQGARLTSWELFSQKIKVILITDSTAAFLMQKGKVNKVITGADRITAKGFTANKIGTYNLAVLCKYHNIPFYIAAPSSTFDLSIKKGSGIPIEERCPEEIRKIKNTLIAPDGVDVWNPAFDITPPNLITGIITEKGIIYPPFNKNINKFLR